MPSDREIAEAARDVHRPADPSLGAYAAFSDRFTPERVMALLEVVEASDELREAMFTHNTRKIAALTAYAEALSHLNALDRSDNGRLI